MNVYFEYVDFDGVTKGSTAEVVENGEWFHAQNLSTFGCGKKVSSFLCWHPVRAALKELVGGREVKTWVEKTTA